MSNTADARVPCGSLVNERLRADTGSCIKHRCNSYGTLALAAANIWNGVAKLVTRYVSNSSMCSHEVLCFSEHEKNGSEYYTSQIGMFVENRDTTS